MKPLLLLCLLLAIQRTHAQKVYFYGDVVTGQKVRKMYYRFEDQKFDTARCTYANFEAPDEEGYVTTYRAGFDLSDLQQHRYLYFSRTPSDIPDPVVRDQNRIDLGELLLLLGRLPADAHAIIANDLYPDSNFLAFTHPAAHLSISAQTYTGRYTFDFYVDHRPYTIELGAGGIFYANAGPADKQPYFLNESIGKWEPGKNVLRVYDVIKYNRRIGNKRRPGNAGPPFDLLLLENGHLGIYNPAPAITVLKKLP